jgi:hypothetical protein
MLQQLSMRVVMHNRCRHQQPMIQLLSLHVVNTGVWSIFPVHIIYVCCKPSATTSSYGCDDTAKCFLQHGHSGLLLRWIHLVIHSA